MNIGTPASSSCHQPHRTLLSDHNNLTFLQSVYLSHSPPPPPLPVFRFSRWLSPPVDKQQQQQQQPPRQHHGRHGRRERRGKRRRRRRYRAQNIGGKWRRVVGGRGGGDCQRNGGEGESCLLWHLGLGLVFSDSRMLWYRGYLMLLSQAPERKTLSTDVVLRYVSP